MKSGQIIEEGVTANVFAAPQQDYTRKLIASAPHLPELEVVP